MDLHLFDMSPFRMQAGSDVAAALHTVLTMCIMSALVPASNSVSTASAHVRMPQCCYVGCSAVRDWAGIV